MGQTSSNTSVENLVTATNNFVAQAILNSQTNCQTVVSGSQIINISCDYTPAVIAAYGNTWGCKNGTAPCVPPCNSVSGITQDLTISYDSKCVATVAQTQDLASMVQTTIQQQLTNQDDALSKAVAGFLNAVRFGVIICFIGFCSFPLVQQQTRLMPINSS